MNRTLPFPPRLMFQVVFLLLLQYLNNNGISISEHEIIAIDINSDGNVSVTIEINILTPSEGQSITGDVNITFEII